MNNYQLMFHSPPFKKKSILFVFFRWWAMKKNIGEGGWLESNFPIYYPGRPKFMKLLCTSPATMCTETKAQRKVGEVIFKFDFLRKHKTTSTRKITRKIIKMKNRFENKVETCQVVSHSLTLTKWVLHWLCQSLLLNVN